jgi:hypothetical protein
VVVENGERRATGEAERMLVNAALKSRETPAADPRSHCRRGARYERGMPIPRWMNKGAGSSFCPGLGFGNTDCHRG